MTAMPPHNEWDELTAAQRSEAELARIMRDGPDPCSRDELTRVHERAYRDALRAMAREEPDPVSFAAWLETAEPEAAGALKRAWIGKSQPYAGGWRVADDEHVAILFSLGLVGWVSRTDRCSVTVFGNTVRRIMLCELEDEGGA